MLALHRISVDCNIGYEMCRACCSRAFWLILNVNLQAFAQYKPVFYLFVICFYPVFKWGSAAKIISLQISLNEPNDKYSTKSHRSLVNWEKKSKNIENFSKSESKIGIILIWRSPLMSFNETVSSNAKSWFELWFRIITPRLIINEIFEMSIILYNSLMIKAKNK